MTSSYVTSNGKAGGKCDPKLSKICTFLLRMFFQTIVPTFYPSYKQIYSTHDPLKINSFD